MIEELSGGPCLDPYYRRMTWRLPIGYRNVVSRVIGGNESPPSFIYGPPLSPPRGESRLQDADRFPWTHLLHRILLKIATALYALSFAHLHRGASFGS